MRVLLVSANFRPHVGGIERFVEVLATELTRRGHEVTVLCCRDGNAPRRETADSVSIVRVPSSYALQRRLKVPYPVPSPVHLLARIRELMPGADVVHVQDAIYATSLPALLAARQRHIPSVLTQHVALVPQSGFALDALQRAAVATIGRCSRLATLVATLNPALAAWTEATWGLRNVRVLPVGVAPLLRPTADERSEIRRSFRLPVGRFLALFAGRNVPKKGLDVFVHADHPAYDLIAVTDLSPQHGNAMIFPFMDAARFRELLVSVDAFVLPSVGEGFPISIQEALVAGLPVITTSQPGYEHHLTSDDVLFVERTPEAVRKALLRLVEEPGLRERLSKRAAAVGTRHFGLEPFVTAYEELYEEAFAMRRSMTYGTGRD
jgi:glycosyltransferase involved in cell wall biosynthesis